MKLKSKSAIVAGASTGIGRAIAVEFGKEGATVVVTARTEDRLNETKSLIEEGRGKVGAEGIGN